jgi:hypothetical protein
MVERMFEQETELTESEYDAFVIACLETEFGASYPDPADFVVDEHQRFLDARARLLATGATHLDSAESEARAVARAEASRARSLAAFARSRPATMFDRAPGEQGAASAASMAARPPALTDVSEWAVDEAAATLGISGRAASLLLVEAVTLVEGLPGTLAALSAGDISYSHARVMIEVAGLVADPAKRAAVEAAVLPRAPGQTAPALRASAKRAVARIDAAAAADRLAKAVRDRHVRLDVRDDGMSALSAQLTTPVARACYEALSAYAKACEYDEEGNRDPRTHGQRMTDCLTDLILRPHADHRPVRVALTLVAGVDTLTGQGPGAEDPGEVDGDLVPAALVRELARTLGLLPRPGTHGKVASDRPTDSGECRRDDADSSEAGCTEDGWTEPAATAAPPAGDDEDDAEFADLRTAWRSAAKELLAERRAAGRRTQADGTEQPTPTALSRLLETRRLIDTALAERPRIAVVDQLSGTLLALTDTTGLRAAVRSGRGLGPPGGTDAYRPTDPLQRFVKLRDRRCRFPGCRTRARCCDLDHQVPHPSGSTAHDNLACLCEHHHRLSHQAPGWRLRRDADGGLAWTLPGGRTITTYPPAVGSDDAGSSVQLPARTGRQRYADLLVAMGEHRPTARTTEIPF